MAWLSKSKSMKMGKSSSSASLLKSLLCRPPRSSYSTAKRSSNSSFKETHDVVAEAEEEVEAAASASSGISRPLSEILKELNKRVPDSLVKVFRSENDFSIKYVPWHVMNRILNLHAPEWSGEVRSITYSGDAKSVSVVYRVTLYGTDAEIYRESTGTASVDDTSYGDPVQKAEAMAFRRACARFGLGLHLYHEDMS
ncbi:DNA repair RAD52-like protein 1, mitochondrial [Quercus suber]|uniref:Dna repair rad52-like protein 1 n=1 Tax=Quercus suber TaxID=58331 RepID=A0AAW0LWK8_QUESU|nr:DNA repair RAD52-like protein 1, mitochondrial [Quercus suber]XP_023904671.1 DNA repair RAD52-like protein 1, mitochondrial [Quercus suber]POE45215.1 dna repair rad52-like protein 1, mitochondrial [Quercus suber]